MNKIFGPLLLLIPLAIAAEFFSSSALLTFLLSAAAIIPLAKYIGDATEDLAVRTNPAIGGLLNATFGNATELIVSVFAIQAGLVEVAKASIAGAIIGNLL
jgi:Ca2+:H+ antiporter